MLGTGPPSAPGGGFGMGQSEFETSFRQFCSQPENQALVEKTQRAEVRKVHMAEEHLRALKFREVVLAASPEAQRAVAPFLKLPVLRRIVQTIANDPSGDFTKWATNPLVLEHLSVAKKAIDDGLITEQEAEHLILAQVKDPQWNPQAAATFAATTKPKARLDTVQLVGALNEQLQERNAGNTCYKAKRWADAMNHYQRALAILDFVQGGSAADQGEVDANKVAVLWNMGAVHLAQSEYGACVARCTEALKLEPDSIRVLLRRAKAYVGRGEYGAAEADVSRVKDLEPWSFDAEDVVAQLRAARQKHSRAQSQFAAAALGK